ncbi:MAG: type II toxin-antitoxin system RelE/ParE family toxin [Thermodesulfovibrionales bacterium]|nr:type II toxin-antitoxin system RelE/ParE family toxin [Thermodesulfovibrionales bacterium]
MRIFQSGSFERKVKKISAQEKGILDKAIRKIADNLSIGDEKKGDLRGIFIHKFKMKTAEYLLAYRVIGKDLEFIMLGPHENYYRDLKNYLKSR